MVAHQGRGWRLAPSLIAAENQANTLAPRRSQASDGSIGDTAHSARASDHNPAGGWVHAIDLTHDPRGGFDAHAQVRGIAARRDPRVKYLISAGEIWDPKRGWRRYTGENRHDKHAHISIWPTAAARNDVRPWFTGAPAGPAPTPPTIVQPLEDNVPAYFLVTDDPTTKGDLPKGAVIRVTADTWAHLTPDDWSVEQELFGAKQPQPINQPKARSIQRTRLAGTAL